jgi:hypothetical protein
MESAIKLVGRFIAGVTKPASPTASETDTNPIRPLGEHCAAAAV